MLRQQAQLSYHDDDAARCAGGSPSSCVASQLRLCIYIVEGMHSVSTAARIALQCMKIDQLFKSRLVNLSADKSEGTVDSEAPHWQVADSAPLPQHQRVCYRASSQRCTSPQHAAVGGGAAAAGVARRLRCRLGG